MASQNGISQPNLTSHVIPYLKHDANEIETWLVSTKSQRKVLDQYQEMIVNWLINIQASQRYKFVTGLKNVIMLVLLKTPYGDTSKDPRQKLKLTKATKYR